MKKTHHRISYYISSNSSKDLRYVSNIRRVRLWVYTRTNLRTYFQSPSVKLITVHKCPVIQPSSIPHIVQTSDTKLAFISFSKPFHTFIFDVCFHTCRYLRYFFYRYVSRRMAISNIISKFPLSPSFVPSHRSRIKKKSLDAFSSLFFLPILLAVVKNDGKNFIVDIDTSSFIYLFFFLVSETKTVSFFRIQSVLVLIPTLKFFSLVFSYHYHVIYYKSLYLY